MWASTSPGSDHRPERSVRGPLASSAHVPSSHPTSTTGPSNGLIRYRIAGNGTRVAEGANTSDI